MPSLAGWYRVDVPHYCCAFVLDDAGVIIRTAPIMRSWTGQTVQEYARWARTRGGTFTRL